VHSTLVKRLVYVSIEWAWQPKHVPLGSDQSQGLQAKDDNGGRQGQVGEALRSAQQPKGAVGEPLPRGHLGVRGPAHKAHNSQVAHALQSAHAPPGPRGQPST